MGAALVLPSIAMAQGGGGVWGHKPAYPVRASTMEAAIHPFIDTSRHDLVTTNLQGASIRFSQWFFAAYRNSYGDDSYVVAVERHWGTISWSLFEVGAGYRAGIVTGYDERLIGLAGHTPILPIVGLVGWANVGWIGINVFYAYRAGALEVAWRCC